MFNLRQRKNGRPLLVGHRGAMDVAPENTMPALIAGHEGGADILELDVRLTADKKVVLFHDTTLAEKTGVPGKVRDYTAKFLQTLDVGRYFSEEFTGIRMPLLTEVLAWASGRTALMIELKHGPDFDPELDTTTVRLIQEYEMVDDVVMISFDQFALKRVKALEPNLTTSLIYVGRFLDPLSLAAGCPLNALSPSTDYLTKVEVQRIHAAGYACSPGGFAWDYPKLLQWNVDSISSNNPASVDWDAISDR